MPKSAYEDLVLQLIDEKELHIECDEDFNLQSFRSAFYRFKKTEIGMMLLSDAEFKVKTYFDDEIQIAQINLVSHHKKSFKVRRKPNETV